MVNYVGIQEKERIENRSEGFCDRCRVFILLIR